MKKLFTLLLVVLMTAAFVGCSSEEPAETTPAQTEEKTTEEETKTEEPTEEPAEESTATYADGIYFAASENFDENSGWKDFVVVEVKDGKIVNADWNGVNIVPQGDKLTLSPNGGYPMVEFGGAQAPWHEQAIAAEEWLLENQDPTAIEIDSEGKTDALAGVSIHVSAYYTLVQEALASEPVAAGQYTDGVHLAQLEADEKGWVSAGEFVVVNGTIVSANLNGSQKDAEGNVTSKKTMGEEYGMKAAGSELEWFEQAAAAEAFVLETQGFEVEKDDNGKTDAIAGVSISVSAFEEIFTQAMQ